MNKKFEYVDDNPGSYFSMLVESVEDKKDTKKKKMNESTKYEYLEKELAEVSNDKDIERAYDENELTIVKMGNVYYMEHCPDELVKKVKTLMKKYYPNLVYLYDMNYHLQNESLTEDKFVPQDKMSKKAQKELNDKKRGTWGNTNPVTRVQPNKKAYDRKRDKKVVNELLSDSDYKNGERFTIKANKIDGLEFDEDPNMAENVFNAIGDISFNLDHLTNNGSESATYVVPSALDIKDSIKNDRDFNYFFKTGQLEFVENESLKESKKLNESSDGWDESKLDELSEILDELYNLQYEIKNTVRGAYTNAYTYEELGNYIHNLGHTLMFIGDDIAEMEEDEEDED